MSAASNALRDLDGRLLDIRSGALALKVISYEANFRLGECLEADQLQLALQWIADRLAEQIEVASDYAQQQERALR